MRTRSNYGIIGPAISANLVGGGLYTAVDAQLLKSSGQWVGPPGSPSGVVAVLSGSDASVSFVAPVSNGGATITSYTVTSSPGNFTASGSSSPLTVTGLTGGTTYSFTVKATNSYGVGTASASSNSLSIPFTISATYLMVAGGGAGAYYGAGGGAGGLVYNSATLNSGVQYTVVIGAGGTGSTSGQTATDGGVSTFFGATAYGGGHGGQSGQGGGGNGGSGGGGGSGDSSNVAQVPGKGVYPGSTYIDAVRQGYDGGAGQPGNMDYAGGGGGAGAAGTSSASGANGNGGTGSSAYSALLTTASAGVDVGGTRYIAGGGGGAGWSGSGTGGSGGGGAGTRTGPGGAGVANSGGGGGGTSYTSFGGTIGGNGGSGVLIVRYADTLPAASSTTGSPTVIVSGGYRYYKFTSSGTISW